MLQYILDIFIPYIEWVHNASSKTNATALAVMDNFKGQVKESVYTLYMCTLLESNNVTACLLAANTHVLLINYT